MEEYWRLIPGYQGVRLEDLQPLRILFGFFPTYRASPLAPAWDRVLQVLLRPTQRCRVTLESLAFVQACCSRLAGTKGSAGRPDPSQGPWITPKYPQSDLLQSPRVSPLAPGIACFTWAKA